MRGSLQPGDGARHGDRQRRINDDGIAKETAPLKNRTFRAVLRLLLQTLRLGVRHRGLQATPRCLEAALSRQNAADRSFVGSRVTDARRTLGPRGSDGVEATTKFRAHLRGAAPGSGPPPPVSSFNVREAASVDGHDHQSLAFSWLLPFWFPVDAAGQRPPAGCSGFGFGHPAAGWQWAGFWVYMFRALGDVGAYNNLLINRQINL